MQVVEAQENKLTGYRLSPQQRRLWGLLRRGSNVSYQAKSAVAIKGHLESGRLKTTVRNVIARHEILRTVFRSLPGMTIPMQVINQTVGLSWREDDFCGASEQAALIEASFHAASEPFDFDQGPLLRVHLIKQAADDHVMIIYLPAICADSMSLRNLVGELSRSYAASARGEELDGEPPQYADLAEWQNELIEAEETRAGREYWSSQNLLRPPIRLAFEGVPTGETAFEPRMEEFELPSSLTVQIESLARSRETSLEQIFLACWHILLWRHTGQSEIDVGTLFNGRRIVEVEEALGLFAKYLPITCRLGEGLQFSELIEQIDVSLRSARDRQEYFSWEQLVRPSAPEEETPFFPFCFDGEATNAGFSEGGLTFTPLKHQVCIDRFNIKLAYARKSNGLVIEFYYDPELFRPSDVRRLAGQFQTLLTGAASNPEAKIGEIEMVADAERQQLIFDYNSTKTEWGRGKFTHELFSEQVRRTPEAVAVISQNGLFTYRELNERADQLAGYLREAGVGPEVIVGLCMERSFNYVVSVLGTLKAGGAYLPLDPSYPQGRLAFMLEDAAVTTALTETHLRSRLPQVERVISVDALWDSISQKPARNCEAPVLPENLAYVIYTSGSTGKPKGVMLRHLSLTNYLLWAVSQYPLKAGCGAPVHSSLSFDLTITSLFTPLLVGGCVHLLPAENEIEALGAALSERPGYSLVKLTPAHLQLLAEQLGDIRLSGVTHSLVIGGENLSAKTVRWWRERAAETRLFNEYGPTESVVGCSVYEVGTKVEVEEGRATVPIGRPIANTSLFILDERGRAAAMGVVGELYVSGEGLARGYLNRPDLTAERFVPHPYAAEAAARLYRTGDMARYLRDGEIECLGRADDQVKIRGYRIEPGEIEAVMREAPGVREAIVVMAHESGRNRLIGYVVGDEERKTDEAGMRRYLQERLPEYMVPAALITLDAFPLTANGKIDRNRLPLATLLNDAGGRREKEYVGARTPIEEILVGIFKEALNLDRVGVHDNFFAIGGHSLLAMRVVSRVRIAFGVEIGVRSVFGNATVEGLASKIEEAMRAGARDEVPPLAPVSREEMAPLSFAQRRLWFLDQLAPNNPFYNIPDAVRLEGRLDLEALERSVNEIVRRHEVLRTRIVAVKDEPAQLIEEWKHRRLEIEDLTSLPKTGREEEARRMAKEEAETSFDLSRGPLFRMKVLKLEEDEHVVLFTMHHIVTDAWSMEIFVREIKALYQAYSAGEPSPLEELPIQYADYAVWQRNFMQGEAMDRQLGYWRNRLAGVEPLELPIDYPRPAVASYRGAISDFELSEGVTEGLQALSRREGMTLFMTLLAAFKTLLMRYSGQTDIAVGSPIANRTRAEIEGLIGFFVNTLALRTQVEGKLSFQELLGQVREACLGAYAYQDLPFEQLVESLQPERDLSRQSLFQVMLVLQHVATESLDTQDLQFSSFGVPIETSKFDLVLTAMEAEGRMACNVNYNSDLFDSTTIVRMIEHFKVLLKSVIGNPMTRLSELELLPPDERRQILVEWNRTAVTFAQEGCVHQLFEAQAGRTPDAVAVILGNKHVSYGELERRANRLANYLLTKGVGIESHVGVCVERSIEMVEAVLGALKAGATCVPLDPAYPLERLRYMVTDGSVEWLLTAGEAAGQLLMGAAAQIVKLDGDREAIDLKASTSPRVAVDPDNLLYIIYTSGSTGRPKGVALSHAALANLIYWDGTTLRPQSRMLQFSSLNFDASFHELFATWAYGGAIVLITREQQLDPRLLSREIRDNRVESLNLPAAVIDSVLEEVAAVGCDSVRELISTAEQMQIAEQWWQWLERQRCSVWNHYGPSETHVITAWRAWGGELGDLKHPPIGKPIANCLTYNLDPELQPAPVGVAGELYLGGIGLARAYLKRPEQTAERFIPDPHCPGGGGRLYRTGDLVRQLKDGGIVYLGRIDRQVKIRGYRVELGEIEVALRQQSGVVDAAVAMHQDPSGDKRLAAYVVAAPGARVDFDALRSALRLRLPDYMIPAEWMDLERLPLTANGKLDRRALPAPEYRVNKTAVAPRTPLEEIVAGVWSEVLRREKVSVEENFFEIGGHSLLATQVVSRIRNAFGVEIGVLSIFEHPTVAGLVRKIEEVMRAGDRDEAPPLVRIEREGQKSPRLPLSFAQQRLWFLAHLAPNNPFYNMPGAVRLEGKLDLEALERSVNEIIRRHEVLRTRIEVDEGVPAQVIEEWEPLRLAVEDLTSLPLDEREKEARRMAREEAVTGFDLSRGAMLRVKIIKLEEEQHIALLTMHHIVSDGWSMEILSREIGTLYRAYCAGEESPLEELEIQYADYAVWQRNWLHGAALERQLGYWREQLAGIEDLELPIDRLRPAARSFRGAMLPFVIERELSRKLRELGQREGGTLFMVLLGGFDVLMSRYSGQEDIALGTDVANRNRSEIEGLIGFFVNQLVLRVEAPAREGFRELLKRVRAVCLGAYAHQDVPFEKLVEELQPERDLSRSPLFQAKLIWEHAPEEGLALEGLSLSGGGGTVETARCDLLVAITDTGQELVGGVTYSKDLFEEVTIERLMSHYRNALRGIVEDGERPISELSLLDDREREQIVVEWNRTRMPYPSERCIHELFREQAERTPERIALMNERDQVSYGELNRRANQLAAYLQGLGVGAEAQVGLCLDRSLEMVVALLGVLKAGGAYLPLDPESPLERVALMLEDAGAGLVLTNRELEKRLPAFWGQTVLMDVDWENIGRESESEPENVATPENTAYVIYTSGSTGRPKGVAVRHRSLVNYTHEICRLLNSAQEGEVGLRFATVSTIAADLGNTCIYPSLVSGGCLHVLSYEIATDGARFEEYAGNNPIDVLKIVPSHLGALLGARHNRDKRLPEKCLILGGEALSYELVERLRERGAGCKVINHYGPTETTIGSLTARVEMNKEKEAERRGGTAPIGRPIANTEIYVLDRGLNPAPVGARGELYIAGIGVARGYRGRPELTAERFIPNLFSQEGGERLYRTGDVCRYLPDGKIEFIGRADSQVKIRGYRIELGEIEAALDEHWSVKQSVVVASEDNRGEKRLLGYVVGEQATPAELQKYLKERLPEYMAPSAIMVLEKMPLTPNGKLDRRALPTPDSAAGNAREYEAPVGETESALARLWAELLKVERVGRHDNFFELGGHSLLAVSLIERMRQEGLYSDVRTLFVTPTLNEFAAATEEMEVVL